MAVAFQAAGALAASAGTGPGATTLTVIAPTLSADDIMVVTILGKNNAVVSVPAGWTKFVELNNGSLQRATLAWKRAVAGDSGASFDFTRPSGSTSWYGIISTWSGCTTSGTPIDATTPSTKANAFGDNVDYATFDPAETKAFVVAVGLYNEDNTTAGTISGTDPTFTNRVDVESATGTDGSIFVYDGSSTGVATGTRSHSTTSTADAISVGVLFGLVSDNKLVIPGTASLIMARQTPTILTPRVAIPDAASLATTLRIPSVIKGTVVIPGVAPVATSLKVPSVIASNNQLVIPGATSLAITKFTPTILSPRLAIPGVASLIATRLTPIILAPRLATPGAASLVITKFAPAALAPRVVIPGAASLALTRLTPTIRLDITAIPGTKSLLLTAYIPTVYTGGGGGVVVTPGVASLVITRLIPNTLTPKLIVPGTATLALTSQGPAIFSFGTYGGPLLWTAANWGAVNIYLEVYIKATTGVVYARLVDGDGNVVASSEVSTVATSFQRLRSPALTLSDTKVYRAQLGKAVGDAGELISAKLVVVPN